MLARMKELVQSLIEKANLTEEQANNAANVVKGFLGDRLPDAIKGPVLGALTGENIDNAVDKARDLIGGLFSK